VIPIAARILDAGEQSRGGQALDCFNVDSRRELRDVVEENRYRSCSLPREFEQKRLDFRLFVAKKVRGHDKERIGPGGNRLIRELDGSSERGVRNASNERHAAAFCAEIDEPLPVGEAEIEELSGRSKYAYASHACIGSEVEQVKRGGEIGFEGSLAPWRNNGREHSREPDLSPC